MIGLLTWTAYGTWFGGRGRGWIDRGAAFGGVPEPARRGETAPWAPVRLDAGQREVVGTDLLRIASLRGFTALMIAVAEDHVHVLLAAAPDRDVPRLVQLVKGATARALSVAAGDLPARAPGGAALAHHKWWARQFSFVRIPDRAALDGVAETLAAHKARGAWCHRAAGRWPDPRGL